MPLSTACEQSFVSTLESVDLRAGRWAIEPMPESVVLSVESPPSGTEQLTGKTSSRGLDAGAVDDDDSTSSSPLHVSTTAMQFTQLV